MVAVPGATGALVPVGSRTADGGDGRVSFEALALGSAPAVQAPVARVFVSPANAAVAVGDTTRFVVSAQDGSGRSVPVTEVFWGSTSHAVALVNSSGVVRGVAAGSIWIFATVAGVTGSQPLTVSAATTPGTVRDLQVVSSTSTSVTLRWTQVDNGSGRPANYALRRGSPTLSWGASAGTEMSVTGTQVGATMEYTWTGLTPGAAHQFQLRAYRGVLDANAPLGALSNVASATTAAPARVATVRLSPAGMTLASGDTARFTVTALDGSGKPVPVSNPFWGSTSHAVALVDGSGLVTGVAPGNIWIFATVQGVTGSQPLTVTSGSTNPSAVSDLQVVSTTQSSVTLRWTQVRDGLGAPADYTLRHGSPTISWQNAAGTAVSILGTQTGTTIEYTRTGLSAGTQYQFQLASFRGTLGLDAILGAPSNVVTVSTQSVNTPPPPSGGTPAVYMHADWSTATGTSAAAILDQGKQRPFNYREGFATVNSNACPSFTVLNTAGAGRDFPTTNFIRMRAFDACAGIGAVDGWSQIGFLSSSNYIPALAVGDSVFVRYYVRVMYPYQALDRITHGDEWKDWPLPYGVGYNYGGSGWQMDLHGLVSPAAGSFCVGNQGQYPLSKGTTYRIEHGVIRTSSSGYQIRARIYGPSGALLYDSADFRGDCWGGTISGTAIQDHTWTGTSATWNTQGRQFHLGLNGISGLTTSNDEQDVFEWAGFAVCSSWCGKYPIPGAEN
ncbi:MAG: fibronectin type III domain-containing protein [Dehalococcoidia bacterium]